MVHELCSKGKPLELYHLFVHGGSSRRYRGTVGSRFRLAASQSCKGGNQGFHYSCCNDAFAAIRSQCCIRESKPMSVLKLLFSSASSFTHCWLGQLCFESVLRSSRACFTGKQSTDTSRIGPSIAFLRLNCSVRAPATMPRWEILRNSTRLTIGTSVPPIITIRIS